MTAKQALIERIPALTEELAADLLDYLNLLVDPDEASEDDLEAVRKGREAFERGECIEFDAIKKLLSE